MGFKKMDNSLGFADLALASSLKHNRSLKLMDKLDKSIEWSRIEAILLSHYTVGTSCEGADAYPRSRAEPSHSKSQIYFTEKLDEYMLFDNIKPSI